MSRVYKGIGNDFRRLSQYEIMRRWEREYGIRSALEAPFDQATDGVDGEVFSCPHHASRGVKDFPPNTFDFVWNFGFLQRDPGLIYAMKDISQRYVAAFVPNAANIGVSLFHPLYHRLYGIACVHPERGDRRLMNLAGLEELFRGAGLTVIEKGYVDLPPWPDTVVTLSELFGGSTERRYLKIPLPLEKLIKFEKIAFPRLVFAHHIYVLGKKVSKPWISESTMDKVRLYHPEEEGIGATYGSYIRNEFLANFADKYEIKTVCEFPIDPFYETPGSASLIFALKGCQVTLVYAFEERLSKAQQLWNEYGLSSNLRTVKSSISHSPFRSDEFDLVWNYHVIQHAKEEFKTEPRDCIREMLRISRRFVLIIVPNKLNYGYYLHKAKCLITRSKSQFGSGEWMKTKPVMKILNELNVKKIEKGLIDMPPFPSFDALSFVRKIRKAVRRDKRAAPAKSDGEIAKSMEKYALIERSSLPTRLKVGFAHAYYILVTK